MTIDQQRETFEAWARTALPSVGFTTHRGDDDEYYYDYQKVNIAWLAWQAAIEWGKKNVCNRN